VVCCVVDPTDALGHSALRSPGMHRRRGRMGEAEPERRVPRLVGVSSRRIADQASDLGCSISGGVGARAVREDAAGTACYSWQGANAGKSAAP